MTNLLARPPRFCWHACAWLQDHGGRGDSGTSLRFGSLSWLCSGRDQRSGWEDRGLLQCQPHLDAGCRQPGRPGGRHTRALHCHRFPLFPRSHGQQTQLNMQQALVASTVGRRAAATWWHGRRPAGARQPFPTHCSQVPATAGVARRSQNGRPAMASTGLARPAQAAARRQTACAASGQQVGRVERGAGPAAGGSTAAAAAAAACCQLGQQHCCRPSWQLFGRFDCASIALTQYGIGSICKQAC